MEILTNENGIKFEVKKDFNDPLSLNGWVRMRLREIPKLTTFDWKEDVSDKVLVSWEGPNRTNTFMLTNLDALHSYNHLRFSDEWQVFMGDTPPVPDCVVVEYRTWHNRKISNRLSDDPVDWRTVNAFRVMGLKQNCVYPDQLEEKE